VQTVVQCAADSESCGATSSDDQSPAPAALQQHTLPSASLLMSQLLTQQLSVVARTDDVVDSDALTLARCPSPGLLTDITSLLASYQNC